MPGLMRIASAPARRPTTADRSSNPGRGPLYRPWSIAATMAFDPPSNSRASRISPPEPTGSPPPSWTTRSRPRGHRRRRHSFVSCTYAMPNTNGVKKTSTRTCMVPARTGCEPRAHRRTIRPLAPLTGTRAAPAGMTVTPPEEAPGCEELVAGRPSKGEGLEPKADPARGDRDAGRRRVRRDRGDRDARGHDGRHHRTDHRPGIDCRVGRTGGQPVDRIDGARHPDALAQLRHGGQRHRHPVAG